MASADTVLDDTERAGIRRAIERAEARTAGEIYVVLARRSDDYRYIPLLWATLVALVAPLLLIFSTTLPAADIYLIQLVLFAVLAGLLSIPAIRPMVVPKRVRHGRAHRNAVEQFLAHNLHTTEARTGVLIFVSLAEHFAEIVADTGIAAKVPATVWKETVDRLTADIAAGRLHEGLIGAVERTGALLAEHFPPRATALDELGNDVVLL